MPSNHLCEHDLERCSTRLFWVKNFITMNYTIFLHEERSFRKPIFENRTVHP